MTTALHQHGSALAVTGAAQLGTVRPAAQPTIWGLSLHDLHDAYWRSRGVQCVRPMSNGASATSDVGGPHRQLDPDSELFLLLGDNQLVLFDLDQIMHRLIWRGALATYGQVVDAMGKYASGYRERAMLDERGYVQRIAREYATPIHHATVDSAALRRIMITDRPRIAEAWRRAESYRAARRAARSTVPVHRTDRLRVLGQCFNAGSVNDIERFLNELLERWPYADHAIDGIEEIKPGVWLRSGDAELPNTVLVGPVWLGCGLSSRENAPECIVGPHWMFDRAEQPETGRGVRLRSIGEIIRIGALPARVNRVCESPSRRPGYAATKRVFDIIVSTGLLVVAAPLLVLIALAILLDDWFPVLFRHSRESRGGRPFSCLKFRTMRRDAEQLVPELADQNVCDGPQVFIKHDPRVTRVGRVLRRYHLDELPQLFNVLCGDMSIVGPRPSPKRENQFCPAWRELRLSVRPGLTGLWQIKRTRMPGRDFQEWIQYDIEYVRQASLWLDLCICVRTAHILLFGGKKS